MADFGLSVTGTYSQMTDQELDNTISTIKSEMPNAGYRMIQGHLVAMGHRVQWWRMKASMHRVDGAGIIRRLTELGCVVRRSYSVRGPLSLVHVDTNHKLIRYNIVIFGGVDGYSRKILYLDAATNNCASTGLSFFSSVENVGIANYMFATRGTGRASFISGKSVHNQRIERMWRDVWVAVTSKYYELLHTLEEDGLLDISEDIHLFGVHFVFVPRIQADLQTFTHGWNNHPLRTEGNLSPEQLWCLGQLHNQDELELHEDIIDPGIDWESAVLQEETSTGVVVPEVQCPVNVQVLQQLQSTINPLEYSESYGRDLVDEASGQEEAVAFRTGSSSTQREGTCEVLLLKPQWGRLNSGEGWMQDRTYILPLKEGRDLFSSQGISSPCADVAVGLWRQAQYGERGKDSTKLLMLELEGGGEVSPMAFIRAAKNVSGKILACRQISKQKYEVTVATAGAKEGLLDGFRNRETKVHGRDISTDELVVSFMGLPAYIKDEEIEGSSCSGGHPSF
ncbi:hypothetical protein WMY93_027157 [Mugilogobius chulae]|uniref:Integrase core domain-containing protein n=1 Tax=Mugilogobius chulae TaxID=88201 RepID=A0AAW0MS57_9GOBI